MIQRFAIGGLLLSMLLIGLAYASAFLPGGAPAWAAWCMALGIAVSFVAIIALGAARGDRIGRLAAPLAFIFVVLAGGFGLALTLPPADPAAPVLWLGLPRGAAVVLYGVGLIPLLGVPLAYAWTFDEMTLSEADLEGVRAAARALREGGGDARYPREPVPSRHPGDAAG